MTRRLLLALAVAGVMAFCLGPFLWQTATSLKPDEELTRLPPLLPSRVEARHYAAIFEGHPFGRIMLNSFGIAAISTVLALALGSSAAYALSRMRFRGKRVILGGLLAVSVFPQIATVSPLYVVIRALGLRDTWGALILVYTAFSLPLCIYTLTSFFREIPDELRQAAMVDGCSPVQAFRQVFVPLAAPGMFTTAILVFIYCWNEFLFALVFTATEASRTVPVGIALFPGLHEVPWGEIAAASVVVTLPLVLMVLLFQRRIVAGLTAGAVKG